MHGDGWVCVCALVLVEADLHPVLSHRVCDLSGLGVRLLLQRVHPCISLSIIRRLQIKRLLGKSRLDTKYRGLVIFVSSTDLCSRERNIAQFDAFGCDFGRLDEKKFQGVIITVNFIQLSFPGG